MNKRFSNTTPDSKGREPFDKKQKFLGNYIGIVIQNNDPEKRGRVKIYIPHLTGTVYENWYKIPSDKTFKFVGRNINSDLTDILEPLKESLPWSECAAPIIGASASGTYNAHTESGSISDSNKVRTKTEKTTTASSKYGLNADGIGEKPARIYEVKELEVSDGFSSTIKVNDGKLGEKFSREEQHLGMPNRLNKYGYQYKPSSYSNQPKGSFSIPNVGSHVYVFFQDGDPLRPVYFASAFGTDDWRQVYDSLEGENGPDYPGTYENVSSKEDPNYNHNTETYRNKYVCHPNKGGALEVVGTDNRETIKLSHYSGSFKEFNNETNTELAVNQDQKLVQGDQFLTVNGFKNLHVGRDFDQIIRGDFYKKIGNFTLNEYEAWAEDARLLADVKQLFETKRAKYLDGDNLYAQIISPLQDKSPEGNSGHAPCPVCSDTKREKYWDVNNSGPTLRITGIASIATRFIGQAAASILPLGLPIPFKLVQAPINPSNFLGSDDCPCCGGTGYSPSTFGGTFEREDKDNMIQTQIEETIEKLSEHEKKMGLGGSEIINISKHKVENIGLLMNDFPSVRIDKIGKIVPAELQVLKKGVILNQKAAPLIEYVHTDEMPGGSYTLNCANKFNVHAGANGISFKTYGPVDIGGTIVNVGGEQVNIASENEININAGRVSIVADILSMRQRQYKQVLIESNLGVAGNAIIKGSLHVEGEVSCHHVTAPMEIKETDKTLVFGETLPVPIGVVVSGLGVGGLVYGLGSGMPNNIIAYDHNHAYEGIPSSSMKTSDAVRVVGNNTHAPIATAPQPVENGGFITKLTNKLGDKLDQAFDDIGVV